MMAPTRITLSAADIGFIRDAAAQAFPEECCGLLIGAGEEIVAVSAVVAAPNSASDREKHFEIDPQLQFDTLRATRECGARIVGHYHSHPNGRATPSAEDLAMAADDAVWVIVAVTPSGAGALRAFVHDPGAGRFTQIALTSAG
jgi:proteasome lid subunit RPN8/RPN11